MSDRLQGVERRPRVHVNLVKGYFAARWRNGNRLYVYIYEGRRRESIARVMVEW